MPYRVHGIDINYSLVSVWALVSTHIMKNRQTTSAIVFES